MGVFLGYAGRFGQALIDRQLYVPKDWTSDTERRAKASIPQEVTFATKPAIARQMISRTLDAGDPCAWALADTVYGSDFRLRSMLEGRERQRLVRQSRQDPDKRAYYFVFCPAGTTLAELAGVAGLRRAACSKRNKRSPDLTIPILP